MNQLEPLNSAGSIRQLLSLIIFRPHPHRCLPQPASRRHGTYGTRRDPHRQPRRSRTYRVDLIGVAKNRAVNLSFDLIGFGQNNPVLSGVEGSHVTVRDVRLSSLPQLHDEAATLAEGTPLTFDPYTQVDSQLKPVLTSAP